MKTKNLEHCSVKCWTRKMRHANYIQRYLYNDHSIGQEYRVQDLLHTNSKKYARNYYTLKTTETCAK